MDISIVTGTFNRESYLRAMIMSARRSVENGIGLTYEFVVVDGGSMDGTIPWCREQPDIVLIEHGTLKGAVKAFNDGATAANGNYVILANDDIEFVGDAILYAWTYMQMHPNCGMGCFFQDRNRQDRPEHIKWHVEVMPVVRNGKQSSAPYGQVCIVPKWLGDDVGWWGDYLHTYGGDNEISANIYQTGLTVDPLDGSRIHDKEPQDGLRKINNIDGAKDPRAVRGHHPDSWAWGRKWRDKTTGLVGPVIRPEVATPRLTMSTRERIIYLPIYEPGWEVQKTQKRGLREALARVGVVVEVDYVGINAGGGWDKLRAELGRWGSNLQPTIFLSQLHGTVPIGPDQIDNIRDMMPGAKFVNWNGDYWPTNQISDEAMVLARKYDKMLAVNRDVVDTYLNNGINAGYWQIGYEPDGVGHEPNDNTPRHDVLFLANGYSDVRLKFVKELRSRVNLGLYGQGWPKGWASGQCLYDFIEGCRLYRGAKFSIGDAEWPESGFVSNRVFQALAAGGALLCQRWFKGMEDLGLIDGRTVLVWRNVNDLVEKMDLYRRNEDQRRAVAEEGHNMALREHSFDKRVDELLIMLSDNLWGEGWR